jgi:hypothetical protein
MLHANRLTRRLSKVQAAVVDEWWRGLAPAVRQELRRGGRRPPTRIVARFVDPDEPRPEADDFYEYLVNHEIYIDDGPCWHICSAHPEARATIAAGRIPSTFRCPRAESSCPMRSLLELHPGSDVQLSLVREDR